MEKNFSKLHEDVCFGKAGGKVIWQPRIQCWIDDKIFADGKLPGKYEGMTKPEIYRDLGCSARLTTKEWVTCEEDLKIYTYIERHTDWGYSQEIFGRHSGHLF